MTRSRSRSPSWKHRPPPYRSPEHPRQRHFSDPFNDNDGFHRDPRRPLHWEAERHGQNNSRIPSYNRFNNKPYEQNSFSPRKSPVEAVNHVKRTYSPERHGESKRRFPPKYPEEAPNREHDKHFHIHRNPERNMHDERNGFRLGRREENFHRPHQRDHDWDWHENEDSRRKQMHNDHFLPPPRRNSADFFEQRRFPEEREFRHHGPPLKRTRDNERLDLRQQLRNSHLKDDHTFRPYHTKEWLKDMTLRDHSPIVHRTDSGQFTKIEYDYSHRSPAIINTEPTGSGYHAQKHSRQEDRKYSRTKTSQYSKTMDCHSRQRGKYTSERLKESSPKQDSKKCHSVHSDSEKSNTETKSSNNKLKEKGRKDEESDKEPDPPNHHQDKSDKSSDSKAASNSSPSTETITVKLDLKKPVDKYRSPDNPSDRQMSQDLVAAGRKDNFHTVFEHLESSAQDAPAAPKMEFTKEIITIIHQVKANYFKSTDVTLNERFSKMQTESKPQDPDDNKAVLQTNPEIHRRIDISLADLQSKSHNRSEATPVTQRVIEDPNDLRHDIERRRKERLRSEENGATDAHFHDSYSRTQNQEGGSFQNSTRFARPPFRKSTGRPPGITTTGM
ncbi:BCLAF1 and THRAP3 family member 3 isoform 2-T3 [Discoglossus pictus]